MASKDENGKTAEVSAETQTGTAVKVRESTRFVDYLDARAGLDGEGRAFEVASSQLDKILTAETEEEAWDADEFESVAGRDLVDVEQRVLGFTVHKSSGELNAPLGVFIQVQSQRLSDGEEFTWNTGAPLIIGKLRWFEAAQKLPVECVIKGTDTAKGTVLKLKPVPKRAVSNS